MLQHFDYWALKRVNQGESVLNRVILTKIRDFLREQCWGQNSSLATKAVRQDIMMSDRGKSADLIPLEILFLRPIISMALGGPYEHILIPSAENGKLKTSS